MAEAFDAEQASVGSEADLFQIIEVLQPAADIEVDFPFPLASDTQVVRRRSLSRSGKAAPRTRRSKAYMGPGRCSSTQRTTADPLERPGRCLRGTRATGLVERVAGMQWTQRPSTYRLPHRAHPDTEAIWQSRVQ